jgi:Ca2+-binding EF-hand superfamily protein
MSSGVGGAEDGSHEISDHLVEKTLLSQDQLQKLFYIRRKGWVTQQHVKEFVAAYDNRLVQASKGSNLKLLLPENFLENALKEVKDGELKYGILELRKITNSKVFTVRHLANFLDILVDFPILRQIDLAAFPTFSVDKVAMAILNTLRRTLKLYTPALLPEEKRAIIRRAQTKRNIREKTQRRLLEDAKTNHSKKSNRNDIDGKRSSKYQVLIAEQKLERGVDPNEGEDKDKIKHTPWKLKEDGSPLFLLQRILFHVTPKISTMEMGASNNDNAPSKKGKNKAQIEARSTRRLSRTMSKVAIEMFGSICIKINELCNEVEIGNEELEAARRFREYDSKNVGYINGTELPEAVTSMGIACNEKEIRSVVSVLDIDSDDKISEAEFVKIVSFKNQKHLTESRVGEKFKRMLPSSKYLLHPNSKTMQYWDLGLLIILIFLAFSVPVECAFLEANYEYRKHPLFIINRVIDIFLFFDILAHFVLMYPSRQHDSTWCTTWERSHYKIFWNYVTSWFVIDFVSFIPYDVFIVYSDSSSANSNLTVLRWLKLLRLLRLVKLVKVIAHGRIIEKIKLYLELRHSYQMIFWLVSTILFVIHFMACMWMMVVTVNAHTETLSETWYVQGGYVTGHEWPPSFRDMYPVCLYWAVQTVTTIGYGDAGNPTTYSERYLATIAMLIGSILWAYLISMITTIIHFSQKTQLEHHQMMELLDQFVVEKGFDTQLKLQLREYYGRRQALDRMESYQAIMNHLSPSLKGHVAKVLTGPWLEKVSWLRNASEAFITSVALLLRAAIYPPMETIDGTTFHVVVRGVAIKDMMVKCSGMIWGLDMVLANKELRRLSPAIALTYCELMLLPRNIFMKLLENFPLEKRKVRRASIWLAFRRKFLKHAREVELLSDQIQTMLQRDATEHKLSVRGQFEKYDTAGDGNLTFLQLNEALVNLGFQASPDVIQNIIARFDTNSDGKVSLDEFFDFFSVSSDKKNDKPKSKFHRQRSSLVNISNATETIFEVNENEKHHEVKDSIASNNNNLGNKVHVNNATIEQLAKRFDASLYNSEKRLNDKLKAMQNEIQEALLKINNAQ